MTRALLIAALALLAAPAAAAHAYNATDIARDNTVASQVWGGECAGRLHADVVASLPSDTGAHLTTLGMAGIRDPSCTYQIVAGLDDYQACVVVVHESGHLAGYEHDPRTIMDPQPLEMFPEYGAPYKPCAAVAAPTLTMSAAENWVDARWPMLTLRCRAEIPSRRRCWGTTPMGRHLRWTVWIDGNYQVKGGRWS